MQLKELFNNAYRTGQTAEVLALMDMTQGPDESLFDYYSRQAVAASALKAKGVLIDQAIMVSRYTAYDVMEIRSVMQLPWEGQYASGNQAQPASFPWPTPPTGTLPTVFVDETDPVGTLMRLRTLYPPVPLPTGKPAPIVVPPVGLVGYQTIFGPYIANQAAVDAYHQGSLSDGQTIISERDGKNYTFHVLSNGAAFNFTAA